jgi:hypothetical protein
MNNLRKIVGFLMVLMLGVFALPSTASTTKFFSATGPAVVPNGPANVTFTFFNATPKPGVSTINSVLITPPPNVTIDCTSIKLLSAPKPGTGTLYTDGKSCLVNGFTGIPNQSSGTFSFTTNASAPTCAAASWSSQANAGNSLGGDPFLPSSPGANTPSSGIGCDGSVACGGSIDASPGVGENDPGYANITIDTKLKDGAQCTGSMFFDTTNTLVNGNNKLVVVLSNPSVAFTAHINSGALPLVNGYASLKVKVAWLKDGNGDWIYIDAPTCTCSSPPPNSGLSACMPIDNNVPADPPPFENNPVKACVADYMWVIDSPGFARYFATVLGVGNDPAFGWE